MSKHRQWVYFAKFKLKIEIERYQFKNSSMINVTKPSTAQVPVICLQNSNQLGPYEKSKLKEFIKSTYENLKINDTSAEIKTCKAKTTRKIIEVQDMHKKSKIVEENSVSPRIFKTALETAYPFTCARKKKWSRPDENLKREDEKIKAQIVLEEKQWVETQETHNKIEQKINKAKQKKDTQYKPKKPNNSISPIKLWQ
jgi:hypothetical protein